MKKNNIFKVSVVIPTKNAGPGLKPVLDAVVSQKVSWEYEVLIVDSGSIDGTPALIKTYPSVRLIEIPSEEFEHGKTRNYAISQTSGEFIAMLTQDALPADEFWLAELVACMEVDERIAGVFGRHIAYPHASFFTAYELQAHFNGFVAQPVVEIADPELYRFDDSYRQFLYFFSDNNALLRRRVWAEIPYPDVSFAEDQAWARAVLEAGYKKAYAHNAVVMHSHEYGLIERLQRSFDESSALQQMFKYKYKPSITQTIRNYFGLVRRDMGLIYKLKLFKNDWSVLIKMPLDNLMRIFGSYLGVYSRHIPDWICFELLSRDRRIKYSGSMKKSAV